MCDNASVRQVRKKNKKIDLWFLRKKGKKQHRQVRIVIRKDQKLTKQVRERKTKMVD